MSVTHQNNSLRSSGGLSSGGGGGPSSSLSVTMRRVECVGPSFLSFWQLGLKPSPEPSVSPQPLADAEESPLQEPSVSPQPLADAEESPLQEPSVSPQPLADAEGSPLQAHQDPDFAYLLRLDPKNWRTQDHYAVLGLKALRFKATQDAIKKAYRDKMLMHHPDKRKHVIVHCEDDYFSCITRAWEVLGNPKSRRTYDSVDKAFDDSIPANNSHTKKHFYQVFSKVFERNAYWSKTQPVPRLGGPASTREEVDKFYSFWFYFPSWREFTYQVEEDEDDRDFAEEKRLRKNEVSRIRKLVDLAYSLDPRIPVFKQQERDQKVAEKQRKKELARARVEEAAKKLEAEQREARLVKERQEKEENEIREVLAVERNARKRALKSSRARLRKLVKANDYYVASSEELVAHMMALEDVINRTYLADELDQFARCLERRGCEAFLSAMQAGRSDASSTKSQETSKKDASVADKPWSEDEMKLLVAAVNRFSSERRHRWELVADFVNQCAGKNAKTANDAELKWGAFQSACPSEATHTASAVDDLDDYTRDTSPVDEAVADQANVTAWSESELTALEAAKATYPACTHGRWDKIASAVGTRSREECLKEAKRKVK